MLLKVGSRVASKPFVLRSLGADGEEGGEDYDADLLSTDAY
jgi:hypothetical protein